MSEAFVDDYIKCALWLFDEEPGTGEWNREDAFRPRLTEETLARMRHDCERFIAEAGALLDGIEASQAGQDFWLTRNRHGVGFWGRDLGAVGDKLTETAHGFGECHLYCGDDGKIYIM